jgi:predicted RNase H-like HicB family nuclease
MKRIIQARIYRGERGYVGEALDLSVVTQGVTLEEVMLNLTEAIILHLEGEDLAELGFDSEPSIHVSVEVDVASPDAKA